MRRIPLFAFAVAACLALLVVACGQKESGRAVPRPDAWPRVTTYPPSYHNLPGVAINFPVNDSTRLLETDKADWVTVQYPRYRANLHLTFTATTTDNIEKIIDNRVERMALNSGGNESEVTEMTTPAGFKTQLMKTPRGSITPIQILAIGKNMVVSGALELTNPDDLQRPDSLAPIIEAVEADLLFALKNMQ